MEHCKQEKKLLNIEKSQNDIRELIVEIRVSNEYQKKHFDRLDTIVEEIRRVNIDYGKGIDKLESRSEKLELIIENQARLFEMQDKDIKKILESHTEDIKKLQDERNINVIKLIAAAIITTIITVISSVLLAFVALKDKLF